MELKLVELKFSMFSLHTLLIVPYGIETEKVNEYTLSVNVLLIVPYGIETCGIEI